MTDFHDTDRYLVSTWAAGQSRGLTHWRAEQVQATPTGATLTLDRAPSGSDHPWDGAEVQAITGASTGTWSWRARMADAPDGVVQGLFLFAADWRDPRLEFDIEFTQGGRDDEESVRIYVHMRDADGRIQTASHVFALGFDASEAFHTYEIVRTGTAAVFRIDGVVRSWFDAESMPTGYWRTGETHAYADLWMTNNPTWAGPTPASLARTVTLHLDDMDTRPGDVSGAMPILGTRAPNTLDGTTGDDIMDGRGGDDTMNGRFGADTLYGGGGTDLLNGHAGNDTILGGAGNDQMAGSHGMDVMIGGLGADTFAFGPIRGDRDTVRDFARGLDHIGLRSIDANAALPGDQAFRWGGDRAQAGSVWTRDDGADLLLMADWTGDGVADLAVRLQGLQALGAGDVWL